MITSRQRVLAALNHEGPSGRVAVDFGGHRSSGIMAIAYAKLKSALGITSGDLYVYDVIQQLAVVEEPVLAAIGADTIELGRAFCTDESDWQEWVLPDGTPCKIPAFIHIAQREADWYLQAADETDLAVQPKGWLYFDQIHWPLMARGIENCTFDADELADAFAHNMWCTIPSPGGHLDYSTPDGAAKLAAGAKRLRESTDRAIIGLFGGNLFEVPQFFFRMDNYLADMALFPRAVRKLSEALCETYLANLEKYLAAVGEYIDVIAFGDDLGCQSGPLMSPTMYREYYKPFHTRMWRRAKELTDVKVMLHTCGGYEPLLEDLIDAGLDASNPVQITCAGMDPQHLKQTYGDRHTFWGGGCDTRDVLPKGTPKEVRAHVEKQIRTFAPGGGFVFQQVHNIMSDVPVENILAMFDAVRETRV